MKTSRQRSTILVVDDSPDAIRLIGNILKDYQVLFATNGKEALTCAVANLPDLILLDILMPEMNGYTVCARLKANGKTKGIPVVFITSNTNPEQIIKGIDAGAFYYLTKPIDSNILRMIVKAALLKTINFDEFQNNALPFPGILHFMADSSFHIKTLHDASNLAWFLATMCPEPAKNFLGLQELLLNAVEHGLLGITYQEKSMLLSKEEWDVEVARRQALPENRNKYVTIHFHRTEQEIQFLIKDDGPGFPWESYLVLDPKRLFDCNGRGIALATMQLDRVEYHGVGNEVLAVIRTHTSATDTFS